jgi:hypothetical protein
MNIKEKIIKIIQSENYDTITACKLTDDCIMEFKNSGKKSAIYYIGNRSFILKTGTKK